MQIREVVHRLMGPLAAGLLLVCLIAAPASAGAKMTSGGPVLSATVAGSSELTPGQTVPLTVIVQNSGLIDSKVVGSTIVDRNDLPNTAKSVTVGQYAAASAASPASSTSPRSTRGCSTSCPARPMRSNSASAPSPR